MKLILEAIKALFRKAEAGISTLSGRITALEKRIPKPESGDSQKFLRGDGTWSEVPNGANLDNYVPLFYPTVPVVGADFGGSFTHSWWYSDTIEKHWQVFSLCVPPDYDLSKLPNFSISSGHNRPHVTGFMKMETVEETFAFFTIYSTNGNEHHYLVHHQGNFEQAKEDFKAYYS